MSDEELETSATVAVFQESRDHKLKQNQLQLDLSDGTDGTTDTQTHTDTGCEYHNRRNLYAIWTGAIKLFSETKNLRKYFLSEILDC